MYLIHGKDFLEQQVYDKIYKIIKENYTNIFGRNNLHVFSSVFFIKCANEIAKLSSSTRQNIKIPKYNLTNDKSGLYSKQKDDNICFVVAGGPSLRDFNFDLLNSKTTFVSNKTLFDVPNANYFVTTDYTFLNFLKKNNLYAEWKQNESEKFFVANCIAEVIQNKNGQITDTRYNLHYELKDFDNIIICKSAKDVGFNYEHFNSGYNSGFCSFQLALIMGYKTIYLLGMDMNCNEETHYHGGYGKSLDKMNQNLMNYSKHFKEVLKKLKIERPDLNVISCSPISSLNEIIPYKNIEKIL